jgi:hypothetical protein
MLTLHEELTSINLGQPITFRQLTLFPLFRTAPLPPRDYILLDDGIAQRLVHVTEIHAAGSVPELSVTNDADSPVLLVDGEELIGAKQNRVLNLSILIPAKQKCVIPVSCVECGRWRAASTEFSSSDHFHYGSARSQRISQVTHSMRAIGSRLSFQERVWDELSAKASRLGGDSPTHAMGAIYTRHSHSLNEFSRAFQWQEHQVGSAFAISGSIAGLDLFDHPAVMQHYFPKLLRSFALDALDTQGRKQISISVDLLTEFFSTISGASCFAEDSPGIGKDLRFGSNQVTGAALWAHERYLHLCMFANASHGADAAIQTRLSRSSYRRQF